MSKFDPSKLTSDFAVPKQDMEEVYDRDKHYRNHPSKQYVVTDIEGNPVGCGYLPDIIYREWKRGNLDDITTTKHIDIYCSKCEDFLSKDDKSTIKIGDKEYAVKDWYKYPGEKEIRVKYECPKVQNGDELKELLKMFYCGASKGNIVQGKYLVRPAKEEEIKWCANQLYSRSSEEKQFVINDVGGTMFGDKLLETKTDSVTNTPIPNWVSTSTYGDCISW